MITTGQKITNGLTDQTYDQATYLPLSVENFHRDRAAQRMSKGTLGFYRQKLKLFSDYCDGRLITQVDQLTADDLRLYLLDLEAKGHNAGGVHCAFRALRTFLLWYENEFEPEGWKNPIRKVTAPRVAIEPLEPIEVADVRAMLATCSRGSFMDARDKAILLALMDTGTRASEFVAMNLDDADQMTGAVLIRKGKGSKPRTVYLGGKSRKALRTYLRYRHVVSRALWVAQNGERLTTWGLRSMMRRRAALAGVATPSLHSFRRYFALTMLRNGADIFTLQKIMGHADVSILRRYLAQTERDTAQAHMLFGQVDKAF